MLQTQNNDWQNKQQELTQQAQQLIKDLHQHSQSNQQSSSLDEPLRRRAIKDLLSFTDGYHGGFGESQKFPREPWLDLFLDDSYRYDYVKNNDSLTALTTSLDYMARGGIYDQLGGGFHRYSTDPYWKIPHFEKMLYNQALLVPLYLSAHQLTANKNYLRVAKQTLDFVLSELHSPEGVFIPLWMQILKVKKVNITFGHWVNLNKY
ncbi:thioredoxin domain-containing protein [sulfur-oxidizing endosymbiont of Gigantopelta aegis]|uniref:thioredoxin domain-containing protein n=1 Tax=sulfur-oxidizing endosymbiont of Gigantopelta aegis TaxID=2794934 RepID=UPI0018DD28D8|nr:thioredoxin domain-containing protein [sulfur-oxidizing endosymbiont of Gigantopelta aegis]